MTWEDYMYRICTSSFTAGDGLEHVATITEPGGNERTTTVANGIYLHYPWQVDWRPRELDLLTPRPELIPSTTPTAVIVVTESYSHVDTDGSTIVGVVTQSFGSGPARTIISAKPKPTTTTVPITYIPLTTPYTIPSDCASITTHEMYTRTSIYYTNYTVEVFKSAPATSLPASCQPPGYMEAGTSAVVFSPGICPQGWSTGTMSTTYRDGKTITTAKCCKRCGLVFRLLFWVADSI
jgi:hypothetical protein